MKCEFQVPLMLDDFPPANKKQVIACLASGKGVYTHMEGLISDAISKCGCNICTGLVSFSGIPYLEGKI